MKPAYLVDTDWVILYLNGNPEVVTSLQHLLQEGLALSVISLAKLYEGVYSSSKPEDNEKGLIDFIENLHIMGIDEDICKTFGAERGKLRKMGNLIGDFDLLIASTALSYNLTLLTNNRKHFNRIDKLKITSL